MIAPVCHRWSPRFAKPPVGSGEGEERLLPLIRTSSGAMRLLSLMECASWLLISSSHLMRRAPVGHANSGLTCLAITS